MFKKCLFIALGFVLFSCASLEEPIELVSYDGSQIKQFTGQVVEFKAGFHVQNKLFVPVKMKPGSFEIFVDQQKIGTLYLDQAVKLKAHKETELQVPLRLIPEPGFMTTLYKSAKKTEVLTKISGYPKVGVFFIYKTVPISKEANIQPQQFIPNLPIF
jgi:LEA14-like dessication related protein